MSENKKPRGVKTSVWLYPDELAYLLQQGTLPSGRQVLSEGIRAVIRRDMSRTAEQKSPNQ
jgi:hypothetical protein